MKLLEVVIHQLEEVGWQIGEALAEKAPIPPQEIGIVIEAIRAEVALEGKPFLVALYEYFSTTNYAKLKWEIGNFEALFLFLQWYKHKWENDYPDLVEEAYKDLNIQQKRRRRLSIQKRMPYTYATAYKNRYRGTKYNSMAGRRRLTAVKRSNPSSEYERPAKKGRYTTDKSNKDLGEEVGSSTCKTTTTIGDTVTAINSDQFYQSDNILAISQGTALNERSRRVVNLRGIKIMARVTSWSAQWSTDGLDLTTPIYFHMALVHPKNTPGSTVIGDTDIFRSYNSQRGQDFATIGNVPPKNVVIFNPLNADKFDVYFHKKWKFGRSASDTDRRVERLFQKYVPIKRQIRYAGTNGTDAESALRVIYWWTHKDTTRDATTPLISDAMGMTLNCTCFFREPES